ncbi:hypothetical protein, partial [Gordonibacter urolithinfaciens]|uniref:hypothetical protein n=1 Tax=Gordonibacter urolithinfaciens TaxID=1335613 RepID=UPI003A8E517B
MRTLPVGAPPVQRFSHTSRKLGVLHGRGADRQGAHAPYFISIFSSFIFVSSKGGLRMGISS